MKDSGIIKIQTQKPITDCFANAGESFFKVCLFVNAKASFSLTDFYPPNSSFVTKQNRLLVKMIAKDLQPLSIVEDSGFKEYCEGLNKKYKLPSRATIRNKLLPGNKCQKYEIVLQRRYSCFLFCYRTIFGGTREIENHPSASQSHFSNNRHVDKYKRRFIYGIDMPLHQQ